MYLYFVSYAHSTGFGNQTVALDHEIRGGNDIQYIEQLLVDQVKVKNPVIISWQRFEE